MRLLTAVLLAVVVAATIPARAPSRVIVSKDWRAEINQPISTMPKISSNTSGKVSASSTTDCPPSRRLQNSAFPNADHPGFFSRTTALSSVFLSPREQLHRSGRDADACSTVKNDGRAWKGRAPLPRDYFHKCRNESAQHFRGRSHSETFVVIPLLAIRAYQARTTGKVT